MPARSDLSGAVIDGRYQIIERMAEGAMGIVYRGVRTKLNRAVAIKVMHASLPGAMAARERFEREAKLMALLEHPHCVSVIDYGLHNDKPYVVMELVRGRSLHELIVEQGKFDVPRAADIVRQILSGLAHAHEQGIIHRDVKPANIMITPKAPLGVHARILDFGLARLCAQTTSLTDGVAVGTPSYMAPEQCKGEKVDERADIYACGVVLFELVTGRKPFVADDPIVIIKKQIELLPPRMGEVAPGDYGDLEEVVQRALAKDRDERYGSATAMSAAIEAAIGPAPAPSRGDADRTSRFREQDGNLVTVPPPSSVQVPITVDSTALPLHKSDAKTGVHDPHDESKIRRMLPVSRMRWFVLSCVLLLAAGGYFAYTTFVVHHDDASAPRAAAPVEPVKQPVTEPTPTGPTHSDAARAAFDEGKAYFAKMWWADGIKSLQRAIGIDPSYRSDPELIAMVVKGFTTTPGYDDRLGSFLVYIGGPAASAVEDQAQHHINPQIRARCAALLKRLH
jgi:serine/threonine-protein kinase